MIVILKDFVKHLKLPEMKQWWRNIFSNTGYVICDFDILLLQLTPNFAVCK